MKKDKKQAEYFFIGTDEVQDLGKESFAHFTARTRFRKIFSEHCSGDYEKDFLEKTVFAALKLEQFDESSAFGLFSMDGLSKFFTHVNAKILHPHGENSFLKKKKNKSLIKPLNRASTLKEFFNQAPFFESEILFYHVLLAQKGYFSNRYDFFATEKKDSLEHSRDTFISNLDGLFASGVQDELSKHNFWQSIHYCLSANTSDLSQLNAKERFGYEIGDIRILHDDTSGLYEYVSAGKKFKRFDIICDNAGKELLSDLYLACYFLYNDIVDKVVFHLKPYPFFVSDATKEDFGFMMNAITQHGEHASAVQCSEYIRKGKIEIEDDKFWASPYYFKDMPDNELHRQLCDSDLIIIKGDLNYRRLVEDRDWTYTDSFLEHTTDVFGDVPIFAPRVLKSDVLVGVSEAAYHTAKSSDKYGAPADQRFKGSGKWAVVHFRNKKCKPHKKEVQEKNRVQQKHGDADCENTHKIEKKQSDKSSADKQKQNNSFTGRKSGFSATVNLCYILAAVLILTMLVVSTVPVIMQTVAVLHEKNSSQKTEILPDTASYDSENQKQSNAEQNGKTDSHELENKTNAKQTESAELKYGDAAGRIDFSLLLTGYAIFITGTLILPRYLLKEKTQVEVSKQLDEKLPDRIKMEVQQQTEGRLQKLQETEYKLDGDLSRMIAFLLMKNEMPVWSIGWGFHAIKRYISLECTCRKNEHILFLDLLHRTILKKSVSLFCEYIKKTPSFEEENKEAVSLFKTYHLQDAHCSNFTKAICYEAACSDETQPEMPVLRAVKDIIDVEFIVKNNIYGWDEQSEFLQKCRDISLFLGAFARFIIFNFIFFPFDDQNKEKHPIFSKEELIDNIAKISSLKSNPRFFKQYKTNLKKTIDHIYMNGLNMYCKNKVSMKDTEKMLVSIYNDENGIGNKKKNLLFFFADEESSYPVIRE